MLRTVQTGKNERIICGAISEIVEDCAQSQSSFNSVLGNSSQQLGQQTQTFKPKHSSTIQYKDILVRYL